MVHHYINIVYALLHISILVPVWDIAREVVRYVKGTTQVVTVRLIMCGMVVLVFVTAVSNIVAVVRVIVPEVGHHAGANIRVVIVLHIIVGTEVLVFIRTVIPVRADIKHRVRE